MTYQQQLFPLEDEFTIADVGSPLLEDLAKGVYEPDEVIREYVQNAVDAHRQYRSVTGAYPAQPIHLEVRGKQLTIYDYGIGMDETEVRRVKAVAISQKRESDGPLTGYKGLGIWAGLSFFKNLTLITTKTGCDKKYVLTINFRKIVESLSPQAHIGDVLNPNYDIGWQPADINDHYTIVTLDDPDEKRYPDRFLDPVAVADAVRRICPCEIDENFVFHGKLMEWYEANHIDLYPILVNGQKCSAPQFLDREANQV